MSVDTFDKQKGTKGKNLMPYRKVRQDGFEIYLSPVLVGMVESVRLVTTGLRGKRLAVELRGYSPDDTCCG